MTKEQAEKFMKELSDLSNRYGIVLKTDHDEIAGVPIGRRGEYDYAFVENPKGKSLTFVYWKERKEEG
jgi:hypothetical protein